MALIEDEGGGGRFDPAPRPASKPKGGSKLPAWDSVPKTDPRFIPGTQSYRPSARPAPAVIGGGRFDPGRLQQTTAYTMPPPAAPVTASQRAEAVADLPREGSATHVLHDAARALGGKSTDPSELAKAREPKEVQRRTYRLTWDEYNRLSDEQRAAVDFNTLLVQAREKDLNAEYKEPTAEQREAYDKEVVRMFGEGRGSETFAPETLGVLKQIDFEGGGEDLDDFLGLKTTVSLNDLKDFSIDVPDPVKTSLPEAISAITNLEGEERAAYGTSVRLQESMAKAGELLQSMRASAARNRNDEVLAFGGIFNEVPRARGYGDRPTDPNEGNIHGYFQDTVINLAMKDIDPADVWADVRSRLKPGELQSLMRFADEISANPQQYYSAFENEKGVRSPEEFRDLLGLNRGARDAR